MENDKLLDKAQEFGNKIMEEVGKSEEHAFFTICVHMPEEGNEADPPQIETYIDAGGYYGILAEGLYAELRAQLENDKPQLFSILRDVIHDIEKDLDIDPDEDLGDEVAPTIH